MFFALRSLLRTDPWLRTPMARVWLGLTATAPRGSDTTLTAEELRELAHARWGIENLGFKAANAQVGSKLGYVRNARVKETLLLLWSWGLELLGAWLRRLSQQPGWRQWWVRKTKWLVGLVLTVTALNGELFGCGSSP